MKKILGIAAKGLGKWFMKGDTNKTIVDGVETVTGYKLNKTKLTIVIIAILSVLLLSGVISEETFIALFNEVE